MKGNYEFIKSGGHYVLSLANHVGIVETLKEFCAAEGITCGRISGIGATNNAIFRYLDPATMKYVDKTYAEQMELTSIEGNISTKDGREVYLHVHVTASRSDYSCIGGHLLEAYISGACELFVDALPLSPGRRTDPDMGINLYDFGE